MSKEITYQYKQFEIIIRSQMGLRIKLMEVQFYILEKGRILKDMVIVNSNEKRVLEYAKEIIDNPPFGTKPYIVPLDYPFPELDDLSFIQRRLPPLYRTKGISFKHEAFDPKKITLKKNESKNSMDNELSSNESPNYEKYGAAYGLDDDTIDDALEGDPDNYWNID